MQIQKHSTEELSLWAGSSGFSHAVCFPQGTSAGGVKRAKVESWERSVGTLGGGGALGSLVVRKKPAAAVNKPSPVAAAAAAAHTSRTGNTSESLTAPMKALYSLT